ncbi:Conserved_hypothetical protein [Hexamita inflata]|uniref:Myb-like domain-containing protein n=1 Tax=Hexamita inflata TaxID=28002 RepID=A0AA86VRZ9_9EUKA|nr:Conserved hypothetical protein [Hexamita inflata]
MSKKQYHKWTDEETALLYQTVITTQKNWRMVERTFPNMSLLQLQNKFVVIEQQYKTASIQNYSCNQLKTLYKPDEIIYGVQKERKYHKWTQEETILVFKAVQKTNKNWRLVQEMFPQFSLLQIRNKYVTVEKQMKQNQLCAENQTEKNYGAENDTTLLILELMNMTKRTE